MATLTPFIVFGGLLLVAIYMGGKAMDMAAHNRKAQNKE